MRYLPWRKEGRGICGGGAEEMGWRLGWKGMGEGGARKAEKGTRMKHAAPATCGGGEGSGVRRAR